MHGTLGDLVASYGYLFLFLIVAVESLGVPLPGETALVTAAALAALGRLDIYGVVASAAAGAIAGDNAGYWIGRRGGIAFVRRYGRFVRLDEAKIDRVRTFFDRHGAKTVFIGRFIALLRSWAAALAGVACMPYGAFTLYNALGGLVWAALFGTLGYVFGRNLPKLERYVGQASLALVLLAALVVGVVLAARWFRANREEVVERTSRLWREVASTRALARLRRRFPRAWEFFAARLARGEYLGLHLTVGLVVSLLALWLFGGITEDVLSHDPLTRFDLTLATRLHLHATATGYGIFNAVSLTGSPVAMASLALLVAGVLAVRRQWIFLAGWIAAFVGTGVLDWALKLAIARPRPSFGAAFLHGDSFSFPSGHAMGSLVGLGMLAYLLLALWAPSRRVRITIVVVAALWSVAIGFSRLYLGVHYFSDVIGGYAAGIVWLSVCVSGVEVARRQRMPTRSEVGLDAQSSPRGAQV